MATRNNAHLRVKYGICLNDECEKCKKQEVQEIPLRKDFVCQNPECGKPLRECPPPKTKSKKGLFIAAGAIVVAALVGGGIALFTGGGFGAETPEPAVAVVDSDSIRRAQAEEQARLAEEQARMAEAAAQRERDSLQRVADSLAQLANRPGRASGGFAAGAGTSSSRYNLGYGTYEGPMQGGKPHGVGCIINFTTTYTIDLKKATGETVTVNVGDRLVNVKMQQGNIVQGQLKRADGSERWIIIG